MAFLGSFAIIALILLIGLIVNIAIFGAGTIIRFAIWIVGLILRGVIFVLGRLVVWSIRGVRLLVDRIRYGHA